MSDAIVDYSGEELSLEKEEGIVADATNDMGKDVGVPSIMPMKNHQIQHSHTSTCSFSPVICDRKKCFRPSTSTTYERTPEPGVSILQYTKQNESMALSSPNKNSNHHGELPSHTQCTQHINSHESIGDANSTGYTGNLMTTPTLTLTFSPFLSFSDERPPSNMTGAKPFETNKMIESSTQHQQEKLNINTLHDQREGLAETQSENCENADENVTASVQSDCKIDEFDESNFSTVSETEEHDHSSEVTLTYADNLLLNATKRGAVLPSASKPRNQCLAKPSSGKKRKNNSSSEKSSRQPQKRYSTGVNNDGKDEVFGSKSDGKIRLTTNIPREVEALDPVSGRRVQLFASCSAASRGMGINRTRMSRTCRAGGGKIGDFIFRYVEMTIRSNNSNTGKSHAEKSTSPAQRGPSSHLDRTVVAAASALLLL